MFRLGEVTSENRDNSDRRSSHAIPVGESCKWTTPTVSSNGSTKVENTEHKSLSCAPSFVDLHAS